MADDDQRPGHEPDPGSDIPDLNRTAEDFDFGTPEGIDMAGPTLNETRAFNILRNRLPKKGHLNRIVRNMGGPAPQGSVNERFALAEIARKLLVMVPEDMWTEDFLKSVDIRPMLAAVMQPPATGDDPTATSTVRGVEWTAQERAISAVLLSDEQTRVEQAVEKALIEAVPAGDIEAMEQAIATSRAMANDWRGESTVSTVPAPAGDVYRDTGTGEFQASSTSSELDDFLADLNDFGSTGPTVTKFLTRQDLQILTAAGELGIEDLSALETNPLATGTGADPMLDGTVIGGIPQRGSVLYSGEFQDDVDNRTELEKAMQPQDPHAGNMVEDTRDWYTVRDILSKPGNMDRSELIALTQKMKNAGIFDITGGEPVIPGDSTDPAFKRAWKHLASMSLETGKSMLSVLTDRTQAYQDELESSLAVNLTDPARLRLSGDAYARESIGRKLTDDEQAALTKFIHDLERRNARIDAGLDGTREGTEMAGVENLDEGIIADIDAQMQQYIRDENPVEAEAADTADSYEMFTRMLSGPGRGVGV